MVSLWNSDDLMPGFPSLEKSIDTDVLIVGGGIVGILTAYHLHKAGVEYILVEKGRLCGGVTGNTTAKITLQHGLVYDRIKKQYGMDAAKKYYRINRLALERYASLAQVFPCDFERKDNYVYSCTDLEKLTRELRVLDCIGSNAELVRDLPIPVSVKGAIRLPDQAQFHPLKFLSRAVQGLHVFENTFVREFVGMTAVTDLGRIRAKRIVVATHFPFLNKHGMYFLKEYQHRSYVLTLKNAPDVGGMYVDDCDSGFSFRNAGGYLLLGGGSHRTGKKGGAWQELRSFSKLHYPGSEEVFFWATQDCMSLDGIPYIGQYSASTPSLFVASGFNKWGMTSAMVSAMLLTDLLTGEENEFSDLFDPSRSIWKPQLFLNGAETLLNFLTPSRKRCPHLGCTLKWNPVEHTWDCPCHGSRFSESGKLLDNPANGDL